MIKGDDNMKEARMLQNLGLKEYEIEYIKLIRMKDEIKRRWEKSYA